MNDVLSSHAQLKYCSDLIWTRQTVEEECFIRKPETLGLKFRNFARQFLLIKVRHGDSTLFFLRLSVVHDTLLTY